MNDIEVELYDINYIPDYVEAEEERQANEAIRQANEQDRIALYNDLEYKKETDYWKGDKGDPGEDGVSPIVTTSKSGKTTTLTIVDAEGTKTATILDGDDATVDVQVNGTSIMSGGVANLVTRRPYNSTTNKLATVNDLTNWNLSYGGYFTSFIAYTDSFELGTFSNDFTTNYLITGNVEENLLLLTSSGDLVINGNTVSITNVATPTNSGDAVNKGYVDGLVGDIGTALDLINGESVGD